MKGCEEPAVATITLSSPSAGLEPTDARICAKHAEMMNDKGAHYSIGTNRRTGPEHYTIP